MNPFEFQYHMLDSMFDQMTRRQAEEHKARSKLTEALTIAVSGPNTCNEGSIGFNLPLSIRSYEVGVMIFVWEYLDKCTKFTNWLLNQPSSNMHAISLAAVLLVKNMKSAPSRMEYYGNKSAAIEGLNDLVTNCNTIITNISKKERTDEDHALQKKLKEFISELNDVKQGEYEDDAMMVLVRNIDKTSMELKVKESTNILYYLNGSNSYRTTHIIKVNLLKILIHIIYRYTGSTESEELGTIISMVDNMESVSYCNSDNITLLAALLNSHITTHMTKLSSPYADEMFSTIMSFIEDDVLTKPCKT